MLTGFEGAWQVRFTCAGTALGEANPLHFAAAFASIKRNSERYGTYQLNASRYLTKQTQLDAFESLATNINFLAYTHQAAVD